jgi:hypothetical protein
MNAGNQLCSKPTKRKRLFAGQATQPVVVCSLLSRVREKETEGGSSRTTRVDAHAELLSPPIGPNLMGLSQGPPEEAWGHVGPSAPVGKCTHLSS